MTKKKITTAKPEEMNRRLTNSSNRCKQIFRTIVCMIGCLCTDEAHISEPLSSPCSNGVSWAMAHRNDDDASAMMIKINRDASERKRKKQAKSRVSHNTFLCRFLLIYQCVMMLNDVWSVKCVENVAVCSINHWQLEARFFWRLSVKMLQACIPISSLWPKLFLSFSFAFRLVFFRQKWNF